MPYAPYKRGPVAVAVSVVVALIALALGVILVANHHLIRGGVVLGAAVAAALIAVLARSR